MGGGGGIIRQLLPVLDPVGDMLFGAVAKDPDPIIFNPVTKTSAASSSGTSAASSSGTSAVQESAETMAENAVIKESERRRKAKGVLSTIVTGAKGDTSIAPTLKQTLGGV